MVVVALAEGVVVVSVWVVEDAAVGVLVVGAVAWSVTLLDVVVEVVDELGDRVELVVDDDVALWLPQPAITSPAVTSAAAARAGSVRLRTASMRDQRAFIKRRTLEHGSEHAPPLSGLRNPADRGDPHELSAKS